uniref:Uncharacterized protein n=1 Tax=Romanomermis culicivorax TaxID=13658 RepID=A0A915INN6_ROMCU
MAIGQTFDETRIEGSGLPKNQKLKNGLIIFTKSFCGPIEFPTFLNIRLNDVAIWSSSALNDTPAEFSPTDEIFGGEGTFAE